MPENIEIGQLPFRSAPELTENIIVEKLESPDPTGRTSLSEIKKTFAGKIEKDNDGFASGGAVYEKITNLEKELTDLSLADISNMDNIPAFTHTAISDLFRIDIKEFTRLQYNCCSVTCDTTDFPSDLTDIDRYAYVFTNRNETNGIQILIGAVSGFQYTRRLNNGKLTPWTATQGDTIYFATFDIIPATGMLQMHTDPGYSGANFNIENGNLTVTI